MKATDLSNRHRSLRPWSWPRSCSWGRIRAHARALGAGIVFIQLSSACSSGSAPAPVPFSLVATRIVDESGETFAPFGGGTLSAASASATAFTLPLPQEVGVGEFGAVDNSRLTMVVDPERGPIVIALQDDGGTTLARVFVDGTPRDGESVNVTPISSESSLEAILIGDLIGPASLGDTLLVGSLRRAITPDLALQMRRLKERRTDVDIELDSLVRSLRAATLCERFGASTLLPNWDEKGVADAERVASREMSSALYSATSSVDEENAKRAHAQALAGIRDDAGLDAFMRFELSAAASFAGRVRMTTSIEGQGGEDAIAFAFQRASLVGEVEAAQVAVEQVLNDFDIDDTIVEAAAVASGLFAAAVGEAVDDAAIADALSQFRNAMIGANDASVYRRALDVNGTNVDGADAALQTARDEKRALLERLTSTILDYVALPEVDIDTAAESIAQDYAGMRVRLAQNAVGLRLFGVKGELGLELLLVVERLALPTDLAE